MNSEDDGWIVAQARHPLHGDIVVRLNDGADTVESIAAFPMRLGVAVPLADPSGFVLIDPLEQQIRELVEAPGVGMLVAVISGATAPFFREVICYVRASFDVGNFRDALSRRLPHLEIQTYTERDLEWDAFRSLKNSGSSG